MLRATSHVEDIQGQSFTKALRTGPMVLYYLHHSPPEGRSSIPPMVARIPMPLVLNAMAPKAWVTYVSQYVHEFTCAFPLDVTNDKRVLDQLECDESELIQAATPK